MCRKSGHLAKHDRSSSKDEEEEEHAPAGLVRAVLDILRAGADEDSEGGSDTDGSEEDDGSRRSSRSVSFDETARVVLVPTRQELLALGHGDDVDADGAPREEGLWWTRKDCNKFRRSFRRQIFAQGLQKSCTTLLMGDKMVYKIGRAEESAEEAARAGDADAGAGAGAGSGSGRSGPCGASCGGAEVSASSSPILAVVVQDFV